jgi:YegS/Rv2252/BmrU family lipid kinase
VVNPAAGGGRCGKQFPAVVDELRAQGVDVDVVKTSAPGEASALVRDAYTQGRRRFIAVGGDGTGYEIVNGLFPRPQGERDRVSLGFLPLGTGNSFLRDFTEQGAAYSQRAIVDNKLRPCDVIRLAHTQGEIHYINLAGIGFVADVNVRANRYKSMGDFGYILAVIMETVGLAPRAYSMRIDGEPGPESANFICFNNSTFTGGKMMMAPQADTGDGKVDLIVAGPMGRWSLLGNLPKLFKGTHVHHRAVSQSQARAIDFEFDDDVDVMVDGEALRLRPTRLEVLPGALDVQV